MRAKLRDCHPKAKLPCDVRFGHVLLRRGHLMSDFVRRAQELYDEVHASHVAHGKRATAKAREFLKVGDILYVAGCGGTRARVRMTGWNLDWITSAAREDIHALNILRVNGQPKSFQDVEAAG